MAHHSSADRAKRQAWSEHGVVTTRRYSSVVRLGTVMFWTLIAGLLIARLLVPDSNKTGTSASVPQTQADVSLR